MATLLGLLAAVTYGAGDFAAGLAGRRIPPAVVAGLVLVLEAVTAAVAVALVPGHGPSWRAIGWGALGGVGGGAGTLALYRGLAGGRMTVVAPVSGVSAAVLPVLVGVALGNVLSLAQAAGIVLAIPAIALVSRPPGRDGGDRRATGEGLGAGLRAGAGFALLFIALDRAGTRAGAWPVLPGQLCGLALVLPAALRGARRRRGAGSCSTGSAWASRLLIVAAGILSAAANLLYLASTGHGQLAIVAVLTSLYPAVTVLLARGLLHERFGAAQRAGLVAAAVAVVLVSTG